MKYLKFYESFEENENLPGGDIPSDTNTGTDTSWTGDIDGEEVI